MLVSFLTSLLQLFCYASDIFQMKKLNSSICNCYHVVHLREDLVKKDDRKRKKTKYVEPFLLDISSPPENIKGKNVPNSIRSPAADQSASNSDGFCSDLIEGVDFALFLIDETKSLKIVINLRNVNCRF